MSIENNNEKKDPNNPVQAKDDNRNEVQFRKRFPIANKQCNFKYPQIKHPEKKNCDCEDEDN